MSTAFSPNSRTDISLRRVFRPWRELAVLALFGMEATWLSLWYYRYPFPGGAAPYWRIYIVFAALLLVSYALAFGVSLLKVRLLYQRGLFAIFLLASFALSVRLLLGAPARQTLGGLFSEPIRSVGGFLALVPSEWIVFGVVLFIWGRGSGMAGATIEPRLVLSNFRLGVIMLVLLGLLARDPAAGLALYVFLATGLLALSAARIALLNRLRGGRDTPFSRQWLAGVFAGVFAVTCLAALLVAVVRDLIAARLGWALTLLQETFILLVLVLIIPPLTLVLEFLLNAGEYLRVDFIMAGLSEVASRILVFFETIFGPERGLDGVRIPLLRPLVISTILLIFFALVVIGWTVRFRRIKAQQFDLTESLQAAGSVEQWKASLHLRTRHLRNRLAQAFGFRRARLAWSAFRIRRIYIHLLDMAEKLDQPRPRSQTPLEYLPTLQRVLPGASSELAAITAAYLRVRYGELPETETEVDEIELAWRRVSALGKKQLASRRRNK